MESKRNMVSRLQKVVFLLDVPLTLGIFFDFSDPGFFGTDVPGLLHGGSAEFRLRYAACGMLDQGDAGATCWDRAMTITLVLGLGAIGLGVPCFPLGRTSESYLTTL